MTRVLLTNDDGIDAPGLHALSDALRNAGMELLIVAPARDRSASSRCFSMGPLTVEQADTVGIGDAFTVDGTPVDCVRVTFAELKSGFVPDVVVSGINDGANVGEGIPYSGTVGAACEGAMFGAIGVAVSRETHEASGSATLTREDYRDAALVTCRIVEAVSTEPARYAGVLLNVNVPSARPTRLEVAGLAEIELLDGLFGDERPQRPFRSYRDGATFAKTPGTDVALLESGAATITAIRPRRVTYDNDILASFAIDASELLP